MSGKVIKLCPESCEYWHTKQQVAEILGVNLNTVYNYIKDGLREGKRGTIYCPWIRQYYESEKEKRSA